MGYGSKSNLDVLYCYPTKWELKTPGSDGVGDLGQLCSAQKKNHFGDQLIAIYGNDLQGVGVEQFVGELLVAVLERKPEQMLTRFRKFWKLLPDSRDFVRIVAGYFRDVLFLVQGVPGYVKPDRRVQVEILSSRLDSKLIEMLLERIAVLERALSRTRLNPQVVIEMWLLSLVPPERLKKVVDPLAVDALWANLS